MIESFDHVHLYATDPDATISFWCDVLGAERVGALGKNSLLLLGGQYLVVSGFPPGLAPTAPPAHGDGALDVGFGVAHLGLNVSDLETLTRRLADAGIRVHSEPRGEAPIRYVYFTAPDGVVVELTQYVLPAKLAPAAMLLRGFNKAVHAAKLRLGRALVRAAGA